MVHVGRLGRHVVRVQGHLEDVDLGHGVAEACRLADVGLGGGAVLPGDWVDQHGRLAEVGEAHAIAAHHDVVLGVAPGEEHDRRCGAHRLVDHVRGDLDDPALVLHVAARAREEVARLGVLDVDAGALQHLERREVDVLAVVRGEDGHADALAALPAGVMIPSACCLPSSHGSLYICSVTGRTLHGDHALSSIDESPASAA